MAFTNIQGDRLPTYSFRNRIINGDMRVDQRNGGAQQIVAVGGAYTADRWIVYPTGNSVAVQRISNTSLYPSSYALQVRGNTAITKCAIATKLEGNNNLDLLGQTITLSAKVSSTTLTTISWGLQTPTALDNYASSTNNVTGNWTINSTPVNYTSTFTCNTAAGNGICIFFELGAFTSGNTQITDVQLESGLVATPFERRPFGFELAECQRYFEQSYNYGTVAGTVTTTGAIMIEVAAGGTSGLMCQACFRKEKRISPNITLYSPDQGTAGHVYSSAGEMTSGTSIQNFGTGGFCGGYNSTTSMSWMRYQYTANAEIY